MNLVHKLAGLVATCLVLALDFCMGCLVSTAILYVMHRPQNFWTSLIGGILCLLPDLLDFWTQAASKKKTGRESDHHLEFTHWPIPMIALGGIAALVLTHDLAWMLICTSALACHYIHDMTGPFGGILLLAPLDRCVFVGSNGIEPVDCSKRTSYIAAHGTAEWLGTYWMRFSRLSVPELCLATACAGTAVYLEPGMWWLLALCALSWIGLTACWLTTPFSRHY